MDYQTPREIILSMEDLCIKFSLRGKTLTAIRGASLELYKGESLAIVGESGSGKSVLTKSCMGLLDGNGWVESGKIVYKGTNVAPYKTEKDWLRIRGKEIAMVFQDPMTSLNPLKTIGKQVQETLELHHKYLKKEDAKQATYDLLKSVGIDEPERRYKQYPHEFSGGMRQRIVIAIAVACRPEVLICDEPTTALDVTIQAQIIELLEDLQRVYNLTIVYITHDLGVVAHVADRVAVMYAGEIVEVGTADEIFYTPIHPYTTALLSSLPQLGVKGNDLAAIKGTPPNLFKEIVGDAFAPRNPKALKVDFLHAPPMVQVTSTHKVKTWLMDPRAPKIEPDESIQRLKDEWGSKDEQ